MSISRLKGDVGSLFGIDGLMDDLKEGGVIVASAAGAIIVGNFAMNKLPWISGQSSKVKGMASIALGLGGGIVLGRMGYRSVGAGVAAGLAGLGLVKLVGDFVPALALSDYDANMDGLGAPEDQFYRGVDEVNDEQSLLGAVNDETRIGDMGDGAVTVREGGFHGVDDVGLDADPSSVLQ